jgi:peptidoglycan/LPS O-acetylase OafA/YrhL
MAIQIRPSLNSEMLQRLRKRSHLPALDAVRGIAAILVVCAHIVGPLELGGMAVQVFFVLSGFLITWLLLLELGATGGICLKDFYARRTLRIFPAFYAFWIICIVAAWLRSAPINWPEAMSAFFYMGDYYTALHPSHAHQMMGITWSLGVEEKFYLLWPTVFLLFRKNLKKLLYVVIAMVGALCFYRAAVYYYFLWPVDYLKYAFDSRFADILVGCGFAIALKLGKVEPLLRAAERVKILPVVAASFLLWLVFRESVMPEDWFYLFAMPLSSVVVGVMLLQAVFLGSLRGHSWLEHPMLRYLGRISYSLYLYHVVVIASIEHYLPQVRQRWTAPLMLVLSLAAASASYWLVETPFLRLKRRFGANRRRAPEQLPVAASALQARQSA